MISHIERKVLVLYNPTYPSTYSHKYFSTHPPTMRQKNMILHPLEKQSFPPRMYISKYLYVFFIIQFISMEHLQSRLQKRIVWGSKAKDREYTRGHGMRQKIVNTIDAFVAKTYRTYRIRKQGIYFYTHTQILTGKKEKVTVQRTWRYNLQKDHLLFLSSLFSRSSTTGAAGTLNHHSLNLLVHLSVLGLLRGEYLVNISRSIRRNSHLMGSKAVIRAIRTSTRIALSVAYYDVIQNSCIRISHSNTLLNDDGEIRSKGLMVAYWRNAVNLD